MDHDLDVRMEQFQRRIEDRDAVEAERILHPEYALVLVQPTPAVMSRERWLKVLPDYVVHEYAVEERLMDVAGDARVDASDCVGPGPQRDVRDLGSRPTGMTSAPIPARKARMCNSRSSAGSACGS